MVGNLSVAAALSIVANGGHFGRITFERPSSLSDSRLFKLVAESDTLVNESPMSRQTT